MHPFLKSRIGLALLLPFCVAGCAGQQQQIEAASAIKLTDDGFRPFREYSTGPITSGNAVGIGRKQLVGRVDRKTGAATFALQFEIAYNASNKRRYDSARNARAEPLPFHAVPRKAECDRRSGTCTYDELFVVTIPEADLRAAPAEGYQVKAFAKAGPDALISVPKPLIASLLARIDADRGGAAPAAASTPAPVPAPSATAQRTPRG